MSLASCKVCRWCSYSLLLRECRRRYIICDQGWLTWLHSLPAFLSMRIRLSFKVPNLIVKLYFGIGDRLSRSILPSIIYYFVFHPWAQEEHSLILCYDRWPNSVKLRFRNKHEAEAHRIGCLSITKDSFPYKCITVCRGHLHFLQVPPSRAKV